MKLSHLILAASILPAGGVSACAGNAAVLSAEDAHKRMKADPSIILVDVRTPEENAQIRIPGSVLLPLDTIEKDARRILPDKKRTIFIYCRSGRRSAIAAKQLAAMGYESVFDIGGIHSWPYETESGR